jgi:hypothetical protein
MRKKMAHPLKQKFSIEKVSPSDTTEEALNGYLGSKLKEKLIDRKGLNMK